MNGLRHVVEYFIYEYINTQGWSDTDILHNGLCSLFEINQFPREMITILDDIMETKKVNNPQISYYEEDDLWTI